MNIHTMCLQLTMKFPNKFVVLTKHTTSRYITNATCHVAPPVSACRQQTDNCLRFTIDMASITRSKVTRSSVIFRRGHRRRPPLTSIGNITKKSPRRWTSHSFAAILTICERRIHDQRRALGATRGRAYHTQSTSWRIPHDEIS